MHGPGPRCAPGRGTPLNSTRWTPLVAALALALSASGARGQAAAAQPKLAESATVHVRTIDRRGGPFPGVVISLRNSHGLTVPPAATTGPAGEVTFTMAPGSGWSAVAALAGYEPRTSTEFEAVKDQKVTLLFTMQEQMIEVVKVTDDRIIDLDVGGENKVSFSDEFIGDLPILGRNYQNVLKLAPGVNDANGDGNPNVHGARERDFKATVDGISNVDPLTGTFMVNINPDAIEEIEIVTTGAGAEYGGAVGGFGKVITKQGTNQFEGIFSIYLRSSVFDGGTVNTGTDADPITYHDVRPTLNFTGPIVRDKLFFALFHEYQDRGRPVSFLGTGGIVVVTKGSRNLDKVTWQLSPRNKLIFQAQTDPLRIEPLGIDALTDPRSGYAYKQGGPIFQIHWDTQVSPIFNVRSLIGLSHTGIDFVPSSHGIKNNCGIDQYTLIGQRYDPFGGPVGQPIDEDQCFETRTSRTSGSYVESYSDDRIRDTAASDLDYYVADFLGLAHTLKAGFLMQKTRFAAHDQLRGFSLFSETRAGFSGVENVIYGGGGALSRQVVYPAYPDATLNHAHGSNYALYLEDQFRPLSNVSLRIGLRAEQENLGADGYGHFDPADEYARFQAGYAECRAGGQNPDRCARANFHVFHKYETFPAIGVHPLRPLIEDRTVDLQPRTPEAIRISNTNLAPRLSISWDPFTNGRSKIFATGGRYYGETFLGIPLYEQPPDPFTFGYRVIADESTTLCRPDQNGDGTPECRTYPLIDSDANARISPASIRQVDRNLRTPYQDELTAGFSAEIFQETSITLTAIRRTFRDQFQDIDINHYGRDLGTVATAGCIVSTDGSKVPVDKHKDGVFDDCAGQVRTLRGPPPYYRVYQAEIPDGIPDLYAYNPFFNQINRVGNFNESDYKAYQVEMIRRLHRNWELEASYVWSKATGQAEDYNQVLGNDPTTVQDEYGYLAYDQRHFVKVNARTVVPRWNVRLSSAISWQSGLPYSRIKVDTAYDGVQTYGNTSIQYLSQRTSYPSHTRNDQRNPSYWQFDLGGRKELVLGKTSLEISLDVINALNEDALMIDGVTNGRTLAHRHIGRQFQIGARLAF